MVFHQTTGCSDRGSYYHVASETDLQPSASPDPIAGTRKRIQFSKRSCHDEFIFLWAAHFYRVRKRPEPICKMEPDLFPGLADLPDRPQPCISARSLCERCDRWFCYRLDLGGRKRFSY